MTGRVSELPAGPAFSGRLHVTRFSTSTTTDVLDVPSKTEMDAVYRAEGIGCIRGTTLALLLEGAIGLVAYGVWVLYHVLR
jgi:hypothetical protein